MRVPEPKVFISYRREETDGYAGRLYDAMVARFGEANVFTGIDLEPGIDFVQRINVAVGFCDVVLVIVGPEWASVIDDDGARRLANPDDFVRLEVEAALRQDVEVIPVLIAGAEVPDPDDLPEALRPITGRTAAELSDVRWGYDVDRLLSMLDQRAAGLLFEAGAATRRIEPDTVEARFRRLLVEGAHHGVLPEPALELATYLRPEWEVTWARPRPRRRLRSRLRRRPSARRRPRVRSSCGRP